jgi:hypothetical protein
MEWAKVARLRRSIATSFRFVEPGLLALDSQRVFVARL